MFYESRSDIELLNSFRDRGDRDALAALFLRHRGLAYRIALGQLGNPAAAEDAAQETFLALLRYAPRVRHGDNLAGLIARIALCTARDMGRAAGRRAARETAWSYEALMAGADGEEAMLHQEARHATVTAIARLPEGYRAPVVLHYLHGLSTEETAAAMRLTPAATRKRLSRAVERLRRDLASVAVSASVVALLGACRDAAAATPVPASLAPHLAGAAASAPETAVGGLGFGAVTAKALLTGGVLLAGAAILLTLRPTGQIRPAASPAARAPSAVAPAPVPPAHAEVVTRGTPRTWARILPRRGAQAPHIPIELRWVVPAPMEGEPVMNPWKTALGVGLLAWASLANGQVVGPALSTPDLARKAPIVIVGTVQATQPPQTPGGWMATVRVEQTLKGSLPENPVAINYCNSPGHGGLTLRPGDTCLMAVYRHPVTGLWTIYDGEYGGLSARGVRPLAEVPLAVQAIAADPKPVAPVVELTGPAEVTASVGTPVRVSVRLRNAGTMPQGFVIMPTPPPAGWTVSYAYMYEGGWDIGLADNDIAKPKGWPVAVEPGTPVFVGALVRPAQAGVFPLTFTVRSPNGLTGAATVTIRAVAGPVPALPDAMVVSAARQLTTAADAVIAGTITDVTVGGRTNLGAGMVPVTLTVRTGKRLAGDMPETLTVTGKVPEGRVASPAARDAFVADLRNGTRGMALQRSGSGWQLVPSASFDMGLLAATDVPSLEQAIKERVADLEVKVPSGLLAFDGATTLQVKVVNTSDTPITVRALTVSASFCSPRLPKATVQVSDWMLGKEKVDFAGKPEPLTITPGRSLLFTATVTVSTPAALALLAEDTYVATPMWLRVEGQAAEGGAKTGRAIGDPAAMMMAGYPVKDGAAKKE